MKIIIDHPFMKHNPSYTTATCSSSSLNDSINESVRRRVETLVGGDQCWYEHRLGHGNVMIRNEIF